MLLLLSSCDEKEVKPVYIKPKVNLLQDFSPKNLIPVTEFNDASLILNSTSNNLSFTENVKYLEVFNKLNLDSTQKREFNLKLNSYLNEITSCLKTLDVSERNIVSNANLSRRILLAQNSEDSNILIKSLIIELNKELKRNLQGNRIRLLMCESIKSAKEELNSYITSNLHVDQIPEWTNWLNINPTIECKNERNF